MNGNALYRELSNFEKNHRVARADPANYLQNPINAFLLIKRLFSDWDEMEKQLAVNVSSGKFICRMVRFYHKIEH